MHKEIAAVLAALVWVMSAAGALGAEQAGPYASVTGALVAPRDSKLTDERDDTLGVRLSRAGIKSAFGFTLAGGYVFGNGWRSELEIGYREFDIKYIEVDPVTYTYTDTEGTEQTVELTNKVKSKTKGKASNMSVMVNALYVFQELKLPVLPYAGAGLGWVRHKVTDITFPHLPGFSLDGTTDKTFGYQFMLGVKYPIETFELGVGYRFTGSTKPDFDGMEASYLAHNVELGVTFRF